MCCLLPSHAVAQRDPYVVVQAGFSSCKTTVKVGASPTWDETLLLRFHNEPNMEIKISVFSENFLSEDELLVL
jgi:Ca2+-dependent lipid-binding protein